LQAAFATAVALALAFPAAVRADDGPCYAHAIRLPRPTLPGLHIDEVRRHGRHWLKYSGRYRDSTFVIEENACELDLMHQLIVITPVHADPWAPLEALRRAFGLDAQRLTEAQKEELLRIRKLQVEREDTGADYAFTVGDLVSVISLTTSRPI
jgi:hypothetical protein